MSHLHCGSRHALSMTAIGFASLDGYWRHLLGERALALRPPSSVAPVAQLGIEAINFFYRIEHGLHDTSSCATSST